MVISFLYRWDKHNHVSLCMLFFSVKYIDIESIGGADK